MVYVYVTEWGTPGSSDGQFTGADSVAVDSSYHSIYVSDRGNNRVQIFRHEGLFYKKIEGFNSLGGVAVDSSTHAFWVADLGIYRIKKFRQDGLWLTEWSAGDTFQLGRPYDVDVDSAGNEFVHNRFSVQKFSNNAGVITTTTWFTPESNIFGVDPKTGDVYVYDNDQVRIQKYGNSGGLINNNWLNCPPNLGWVGGIAIDENRDVYVSFQGGPNQPSTTRIEKFTKNANSITKWGKYGSKEGQFIDPTGLAVDYSTHKVYVADSGNNRIQVFAPQ